MSPSGWQILIQTWYFKKRRHWKPIRYYTIHNYSHGGISPRAPAGFPKCNHCALQACKKDINLMYHLTSLSDRSFWVSVLSLLQTRQDSQQKHLYTARFIISMLHRQRQLLFPPPSYHFLVDVISTLISIRHRQNSSRKNALLGVRTM